MLLFAIVVLVLLDVIFVAWLSYKHRINPFNLKKLAEAFKKEFS